jgi:pimeloyl-ACP methyl ester carboxylesterase
MRRTGIVLATLVACVPLIGTVPATATHDVAADAASPATTTPQTPRASLDWRACGSSLPSQARCATLTVPRDWGDRRVDGTYRISVARIPAEKPSERIGVLTFNPGGPGSAAVPNITWVQGMLPQRVRDRFDIVAWDPRGVGGSEPSITGCTVKDISPPKTGPVDWDAWASRYMRVNGQAAAGCYEANRRHAPYVGTWQLVRDLDALRAALGEASLTFWGMSYGSTVGRSYAQYFPQRVRALVLDGVISPLSTIDLWAREHTWDDPLAIETMLDALGPAYRAKYTRVMASLQTRTLRSSSGGRITRWTVGKDIISWASYQTTWSSVANLLDQVDAGLRARDATVRQRAIDTAAGMLADARPGQPEPKGWFDPQWTYVNCSDMPDRPTPARLAQLAREGAAAGGVHVGQAVLREGAQCAGLPVFGRAIPRITSPISLPTPPLIANARADNRTPWTAAIEMSRAFAGSRTVEYGGTHHIVYGRTTTCVDRPITRYLVDQRLPGRDVTCPLRY